jgi:hypothetical protein
MSFETISLLLNWMHLGEQHAAELGIKNASGGPGIGFASRPLLVPAEIDKTFDADDLAGETS